MLTFKSDRSVVLEFCDSGPHTFGGPTDDPGAIPKKAVAPVHRLVDLDLRDQSLPFRLEGIDRLPLYYPLSYGQGGASMQYRVSAHGSIEIIELDPPTPDKPELAYLKLLHLPTARLKAGCSIGEDDGVDWFTMTLGGKPTLDHGSDPCRNRSCRSFGKRPADTELIAAIPPMPVPGYPSDIWWEYEGAYMLFYFWWCRGCNSVLTSNRCT